ncbi:MAG TPA: DUF4331 family protein [Gemmatimonadaceae bacterium]|nr:DUF4331 family protein [Gemmatimonadaceae bacterium]
MQLPIPARMLLATLALPLISACKNDNNTITGTGPNPDRVYVQVQRLGNPLVSEVFFPKRDHALHGSTAPSTDVANGFAAKIKAFTDAFNRGNTIGNTLGSVLVPDMLMVFPNRAASSAGWLSWALASGYGGRKLSDDVVTAGLTAIFGNLLDPNATVLAGLTSDNVSYGGRAYLATFPYLEPAR